MLLRENEIRIINQIKHLAASSGVELLDIHTQHGTAQYPDSISLYALIAWGRGTKKIRISDHIQQHIVSPDQRPLRSMVVGKNTTMKTIKRFLQNSFEIVKQVSMKSTFNLLKKQGEKKYA